MLMTTLHIYNTISKKFLFILQHQNHADKKAYNFWKIYGFNFFLQIFYIKLKKMFKSFYKWLINKCKHDTP